MDTKTAHKQLQVLLWGAGDCLGVWTKILLFSLFLSEILSCYLKNYLDYPLNGKSWQEIVKLTLHF